MCHLFCEALRRGFIIKILVLNWFHQPVDLRDKSEVCERKRAEFEAPIGAKDSSRWWSGVAAQPPVQHKKKMEPGATERSDAA